MCAIGGGVGGEEDDMEELIVARVRRGAVADVEVVEDGIGESIYAS